MARKVIHQLVDDLDGTVLEPGHGETVLFSLDGVSYEIDLTDENAAQLRETLSPYRAAARKVARSGGRGTARATTNPQIAAIREWAQAQGLPVSTRGRIPESITQAYEAAHENA